MRTIAVLVLTTLGMISEEPPGLAGHLGNHKHVVPCCAFSPDGRLLATGSSDKTVKLWNTLRRTEEATLEMGQRVHSVVFSKDGRRLFVALDEESFRDKIRAPAAIKVLDIKSRTEVATITGDWRQVPALALNPDGTRLLSRMSGARRALRAFDTATFQQVAELGDPKERSPIRSMAYHPQGQFIATGHWDATVCLRDPATGQALSILGQEKPPTSFSAHVRAIAFSPKGDLLAAGTGHADKDQCQLKLWDVNKHDVKFTLEENGVGIPSVAFSPDAALLVSAHIDKHLKVWDPKTGKELVRHKLELAPLCLAFDPTGKHLAVGCEGPDKNVLLISTASLLNAK